MSRLMPYDSEGLWLKARLFINRAMDDSTEFEEAAFWACCALELLGKSALSRVSPLLIALPTDDGNSLLIASGAVEDADSFVTVQAKRSGRDVGARSDSSIPMRRKSSPWAGTRTSTRQQSDST